MAIIAEGKPPIEGKDAYNQESIFRGSSREDIQYRGTSQSWTKGGLLPPLAGQWACAHELILCI